MPRRKVQKERQIESDDELSASGPEMSSDDAMSEDELNEHEVMRVQGQGCAFCDFRKTRFRNNFKSVDNSNGRYRAKRQLRL